MAKRRGQWVGDRVAHTVQDPPLIADVIQLLPPALALESIRDIVFERCILNLSIHRLLTTTVTDVCWMAYHGRVADGSVVPLEALNPRSAAQTTMAHSSIVQVGALPVPDVKVRFDSNGVETGRSISGELMVREYDFDVKRSIQRGNEGIFLTLAANSSDVVQVSVFWRTYYTYA